MEHASRLCGRRCPAHNHLDPLRTDPAMGCSRRRRDRRCLLSADGLRHVASQPLVADACGRRPRGGRAHRCRYRAPDSRLAARAICSGGVGDAPMMEVVRTPSGDEFVVRGYPLGLGGGGIFDVGDLVLALVGVLTWWWVNKRRWRVEVRPWPTGRSPRWRELVVDEATAERRVMELIALVEGGGWPERVGSARS